MKIWKCFVPSEASVSNSRPLEVVGHGSETQPQVGENKKVISEGDVLFAIFRDDCIDRLYSFFFKSLLS